MANANTTYANRPMMRLVRLNAERYEMHGAFGAVRARIDKQVSGSWAVCVGCVDLVTERGTGLGKFETKKRQSMPHGILTH